ncbi:hypothetical protein ACC763_39400, partial [Rhizobium ruizarguesonis]
DGKWNPVLVVLSTLEYPEPFPMEHALTVLPKNLQTPISTNTEERGCACLPTSSSRLSHLELPLSFRESVRQIGQSEHMTNRDHFPTF